MCDNQKEEFEAWAKDKWIKVRGFAEKIKFAGWVTSEDDKHYAFAAVNEKGDLRRRYVRKGDGNDAWEEAK